MTVTELPGPSKPSARIAGQQARGGGAGEHGDEDATEIHGEARIPGRWAIGGLR